MTIDPQRELLGDGIVEENAISRVNAVLDTEIPGEIPILPTRDVPLFPGMSSSLAIGREPSLRSIEAVLAGNKLIGLMAQRDPGQQKPKPQDLHTVGTAARILQAQRQADGTLRVLAQGLRRIKILGYVQLEPYFRARIQTL